MSAPMRLGTAQLERLSRFMMALDRASHLTGVRVDGYGTANVDIDGTVIEIRWNEELHGYETNDRIGS